MADTFAALRSLIRNEQSFTVLGEFFATHVLAVARLSMAEQQALRAEWVNRRLFIADRLAERANAARAAA